MVAGEAQLHRTILPHRPCQPLGAARARHDAQQDLWLPKLGIFAGYDHVGVHRQLVPAPQREPADGGDDWDVDAAYAIPVVEGPGEHVHRRFVGHLRDICASRECAIARSRQDDAADRWIAIQLLDRAGHLTDHRPVEGVQLGGPIDGHDGDGVFALDKDVFVWHGGVPPFV